MTARHFGPNENARFTLAELERMPGFKRIGNKIRCACPIHGGTDDPNFEVDLEAGPNYGRGHCFTRGCWGYLDEGRDRGGRGRPGYGAPPPIPEPVKEPEPDAERVALLRQHWPTLAAAYADSPAAAYLEGRGIPLDVARRGRVGFDAAGVLSPAMRGRVVFPLATFDGVPVNVMGRVISAADPRRRWDSMKGAKGYYHPAGLRTAQAQRRTLYVCEGTVDVLAFLAGGIGTAVAICGTGGTLRRDHLRGVWRVVVCFDGDQAGQDRGTAIDLLARSAGCEALRLTVDELDGTKDIAEYWQARGTLPPELLAMHAEEASPLDADIAEDEARRREPAAIAERLDRLRHQWDTEERTAELRTQLIDCEAVAAARARLDAAS